MKRILTLLLVLVVSLTAFVGCDKINIPGVELPEFKLPEIKLPAFIQNIVDKVRGDEPDPVDPPAIVYDIEAAKEYVKQMYVETTVTTGDYEVIAQAMIAGVKYTVDWTVDNEKVKLTKNETTWTVDIDNKSPEEYTYKLTATITAGDNTQGTVSFDIKVPAYNISSFEDYMKAEKGDILTVEGIVVAMCSKDSGAKRNHIYVADASGVGGYLNYNMAKDPVKDLGIQVGMTVTISGEISPSNGMQEFYAANVEIVDKTIKEVPVNDITAAFAAGGNLDNYVATLVTIKGVTIGGQSMAEANHQYLRFSIGEYGSYIRTYVTDFPSTLTGKDNTDKDIIDKAHAEHFGWTANVTGILVYFTTSENPYLIPISTDCFEYLEFVEKSDADKVAYEKGNLTFEENLTTDTVIDLVVKGANYPEVTISWASDNNSVVIADGKATVTIPDEAVTVKLTATLTCGNVTETKEFNVKLSKDLTSVEDAIEIALGKEHNTYTDGKYLVGGIITEVYNTEFGNMRITDEKGNVLTVYGTYGADGADRYDALASKPVAGDYVVVFGILGSYNNVAQMKNGWIISFTTPTSVKDAIDLGAAKDHNDFTGDKILVTGTVTEVYNTEFGNMKITDADGNVLTIYGTYDATGVNRYDAMATKPVAGDVVTILGVPGRYNDTKQIKNGWIVAITHAADAGHTCVDADGNYVCDDAECAKVVLPEADSVLTIPQAKALANALGAGNYSTNKYYITAEVVEVYNTEYGNMNVVDADGNTYVFYGAYDADGTRYDAMATKPVKGDVVTMYGVVGSYAKDGVINCYQLKNGTVVIEDNAGEGEDEGEEDDTTTKTYTKATSIAVGDVVTLVCESKSFELSGISTTSTVYGLGTEYTDSIDGLYTLTVVAGSADGTYAFRTSDGKYLCWTSGNSLKLVDSVEANSSWTVTFDDDGNAIIKNSADSDRQIQWNASAPRFATYTSTQTAIQLYKET